MTTELREWCHGGQGRLEDRSRGEEETPVRLEDDDVVCGKQWRRRASRTCPSSVKTRRLTVILFDWPTT